MELSLLTENLNTALSHVSRFVSTKAQLPILSHILFSTDAGRLKLSATSLEMSINYWTGAKIESEGSFCLPSKDISEFISYLPTGKIDFNLNEQNLLTVKSLKASSTFSTLSSSDFPEIPTIDSTTVFELDLPSLLDSVATVAFASATDDSRPVLTSVLCKFTSDTLTLVATDGFRLSLKTIKFQTPITFPDGQDSLTLLIPAKSLSEVLKIAKVAPKIKIGLTPDRHQVVFVLEDLEIISRLIDGEYPNFERIIPESSPTKIYVNKDELSQAIKLASVFARQSANVVRFSLKSNSLELSANAPQIGQNQVSVDARIEGEPLEIAFNYKFISDFLAICKGTEIVIELNQPLTPGAFRDPQNPDLLHIIMPVRLQD
ncbi:MAG: DNA polymerase III subunit beta [Candidatus Shapirobacteria bacterium]